MNLSNYGVGYRRAGLMNKSLMGLAGYDYFYGNDLPYLKFMSHEDKWSTKKSLKIWHDKEGKGKGIVSTFSVDEYATAAENVCSHYKFNVGTSYAMCSQLTFSTANELYRSGESDLMETKLRATVVAWRGLYEGLGLSGYSREAQEVFDILRFTAYNHSDCKINRKTDGSFTYITKKEDIAEQVDSIKELRGHFPTVGADVLTMLVRSRAICITYRKIEKAGTNAVSKSLTDLIPAAIVAGALRRLGQGNDPVEVMSAEEEMAMVEGEDSPASLMELFHSMKIGAKLPYVLLGDIAGTGSALHTKLRDEFSMLFNSEIAGHIG
jgi:hypothetical protein